MGLISRLYNFVGGTPAVADQVDSEFDQILGLLNGNLDSANIANGTLTADDLLVAIRDALGLNSSGVVRRGKSIISATESRTGVGYGFMPTPDRVSGVSVPADAIVLLLFQGQWQDDIAGAARAAFTIGAQQLQVQSALTGANAPVLEAAAIGGADTLGWVPLFSVPSGLASATSGTYSGDVGTGQAQGYGAGASIGVELNAQVTTMAAGQGGFCIIEGLVAGTYDFGVQFKASSGAVRARGRHLKVWVVGF